MYPFFEEFMDFSKKNKKSLCIAYASCMMLHRAVPCQNAGLGAGWEFHTLAQYYQKSSFMLKEVRLMQEATCPELTQLCMVLLCTL